MIIIAIIFKKFLKFYLLFLPFEKFSRNFLKFEKCPLNNKIRSKKLSQIIIKNNIFIQ
jgi:hypothetical protein